MYRNIAPYLTTCGFSIDSVNPVFQRRMGRCFKNGQVISAEEYAEKICILRSVNPDINISILYPVKALAFADCNNNPDISGDKRHTDCPIVSGCQADRKYLDNKTDQPENGSPSCTDSYN